MGRKKPENIYKEYYPKLYLNIWEKAYENPNQDFIDPTTKHIYHIKDFTDELASGKNPKGIIKTGPNGKYLGFVPRFPELYIEGEIGRTRMPGESCTIVK